MRGEERRGEDRRGEHWHGGKVKRDEENGWEGKRCVPRSRVRCVGWRVVIARALQSGSAGDHLVGGGRGPPSIFVLSGFPFPLPSLLLRPLPAVPSAWEALRLPHGAAVACLGPSGVLLLRAGSRRGRGLFSGAAVPRLTRRSGTSRPTGPQQSCGASPDRAVGHVGKGAAADTLLREGVWQESRHGAVGGWAPCATLGQCHRGRTVPAGASARVGHPEWPRGFAPRSGPARRGLRRLQRSHKGRLVGEGSGNLPTGRRDKRCRVLAGHA